MARDTPILTSEAFPLALAAWLSPGFPVGAFAFSQGLEAAVEAGEIVDRNTALSWLEDLVAIGPIRTDALLLAAAWTAAHGGPVNALALALSPTAERRLETASTGTAFLDAVSAAWPTSRLLEIAGQIDGSEIAYPVAVGLAAAAHGIALRTTLRAFVLSTVGNLVSALLRLGPIGQTDAQIIIARLCPALERLADEAAESTLADLGGATWRADIASMRHETQYSRLFRS